MKFSCEKCEKSVEERHCLTDYDNQKSTDWLCKKCFEEETE